jgi:hypothetical protein
MPDGRENVNQIANSSLKKPVKRFKLTNWYIKNIFLYGWVVERFELH